MYNYNANLIFNNYYNVRYKSMNKMNNTTKQYNYPYEYYITNEFQYVSNKHKRKNKLFYSINVNKNQVNNSNHKEPYKDNQKKDIVDELIDNENEKISFNKPNIEYKIKYKENFVKKKKCNNSNNLLNNKYNDIIQYNIQNEKLLNNTENNEDNCNQDNKNIFFISNQNDNNQKKTYCVNCGKNGHIFRKCLYPILSYGLIAYYIDKQSSDIFLIMIQSKNTFSFLDFICGKYDISYDNQLVENKLHYLFSKMTNEELIILKTLSFEEIWENTFSSVKHIYNKNKAYFNSYEKYNLLKKGLNNISLDILVNKYENNNNKISWSFPKGRRNYKESDLNTAIREFEEETNINRKFFEIKEHKKIFKENYIGDNLVKYEHRYYLAQLYNKHSLELDPNNIHQKIEVGKLEWVNIKEAKNRIDSFYTNRLEIIENLLNENI